jgi:hypothetical protein
MFQKLGHISTTNTYWYVSANQYHFYSMGKISSYFA